MFVLDASVAASWYFPDEQNIQADKALDTLTRVGAVVPIQWWFEIRNVVLLGERRGRTSVVQSAEYLDLLDGLPIQLQELPDDSRLIVLARRHQLTFYDAAYLELAQRERLALSTLDRALAKAARAEGVALIE